MLLLISLLFGCRSEDIAQAHKGRLFDRTGVLAGFTGGNGFSGPVLGPGTHWTGLYDELRVVDCSTRTVKEPMVALTRDGVQFGLDIYLRFHADCGEDNVMKILETVSPDKGDVITSEAFYNTYVRGALGEAVRENISPHNANDLNNKREEVLVGIRQRFLDMLKDRDQKFVVVEELNLSNMDFPDEMDQANNERAVQSVLKDKAIAEREKVAAEIETASKKEELAQKEGAVEAARIREIGRALAENPAYLQYDMQLKLPGIYEKAGASGNMVITAPSPTVMMTNAKP
jgi:regulator of protease activity HflC (stomatin/prohibitin superfamily)